MPHFLDDRDLDKATRLKLLESTWALKHGGRDPGKPLLGKHLAVVMSKPSLRTRVSFIVAIHDLGGRVIEVGSSNTKLGKGEDLQEWAGVLGRMVDGIVARVFDQSDLVGLSKFAGVPVVNALSDSLHPCQGLADAFTLWEAARRRGHERSTTAAEFFAQPRTMAYVGDGNNVCNSLILTATSLGFDLKIACPRSREPDVEVLAFARARHPRGPEGIVLGHDPEQAVAGAHAVYTDVWVSMGQEGKLADDHVAGLYRGFRIDSAMMGRARVDAIFMHCLPAEPGHEVTAEVLRGPQSVVLDQAENRLWTSKALLADFVFG